LFFAPRDEPPQAESTESVALNTARVTAQVQDLAVRKYLAPQPMFVHHVFEYRLNVAR